MIFVFYDTETTGTSTAFDQILQFGAIKTDDDLNELDRFEVRCQLLPYVVPAPGALRVTGIHPATLTNPNLPTHYEAIRQIRAKMLEWSPAMFLGYNSISFDETLLRQALFQTLHPAYLTNTNGNSRGDVMRIAHAVSVYAPNSISIPIGDRERQVFRLEDLATANGFDHQHAHEAMADVEATIHMARIVKDRAPEVWQRMMRSARKSYVIDHVTRQGAIAHTDFFYGREYSWLVTYCGENPDNDAQLAVFDLWNDPDDYLNLSVGELVDVLNASPKVIRPLKANAQPILMPAEMAPATAKGSNISGREIARRIDVIRQNPDFTIRVGHALRDRYPEQEPSPHVEQRIYDGFPSRDDQGLMEEFHARNWSKRAELIPRFEDERIQELSRRLIFCQQPDLLSESQNAEMSRWAATRVLNGDASVPWMTIPKALQEVGDLLASTTGDEAKLLREVKDFLLGMADRFGRDRQER
jgi:exodeoxyribonuclease-1